MPQFWKLSSSLFSTSLPSLLGSRTAVAHLGLMTKDTVGVIFRPCVDGKQMHTYAILVIYGYILAIFRL